MRVTINTQPKADEEDIFKAGTLVISTLDGIIVLVTKGNPYAKDRFCGTTISQGKQHPYVGEHQVDWVKEYFVKFIGNVLLEQE